VIVHSCFLFVFPITIKHVLYSHNVKESLPENRSLIQQHIIAQNYLAGISICEEKISLEPDVKLSYWYLGLIFLLQGKESEAQMTWAMGLSDIEPQEEQRYISELALILELESGRLKTTPDDQDKWQRIWLIHRHLYEIVPERLSNLLSVTQLAIKLNYLSEDDEIFNNLTLVLQSTKEFELNEEKLILDLLQQILETYPYYPTALTFAEICIDRLPKHNIDIFQILINSTVLLMESNFPKLAFQYAQLCYQLQPENIIVLASMASSYQNIDQAIDSIPFAKKIGEISRELVDQIDSNYLLARGFMKAGGKWQEALNAYQVYLQSVQSLLDLKCEVDIIHSLNLCSTGVFLLYFQDNPKVLHQLLRQMGEFCQQRIRGHFLKDRNYDSCQSIKTTNKILKIGYVSGCLREHSVGWLSRWLFKYHDSTQFQIYAYSLQKTDDNLQEFIAVNCHQFWQSTPINTIIATADQIAQDGIDILIDLDSLTSNNVSAVMALKPAPIQITWLGSDASELPAIDYFIADRFVLPEDAQDYYNAKIWRLPHTYIAVDGFEVGVPTLRRSDLNIPEDAIIYLSSQTTPKRHPDTLKLQMQILQSVPNSYFLIKGGVSQPSVQEYFKEVAQEFDVSSDRLRFLPDVSSEAVHRANLGIADVVLDTYPYNGATTTLETLWMCIPLVTRVGEQFVARNSYTMMMNAGITEGLAWTEAEYVKWGVRLGKDAALRQDIYARLRASRQTAPLWNGKQFTHDMENAYKQMWEIFCA
jgi:predicted O-linked N-acetylglucosamine transferase (SPINDLY family)